MFLSSLYELGNSEEFPLFFLLQRRLYRWAIEFYVELIQHGALVTVLIGVTCFAYFLKGGLFVLQPLKDVVKTKNVPATSHMRRISANPPPEQQQYGSERSMYSDFSEEESEHSEEDPEALKLLKEWQQQ